MTGTPDRMERLEGALSSERIQSYGGTDPAQRDETLARYLWNSALCESLYPRMHALEIGLRNSVDARLRSEHGDYWFDLPALPMSQDQKSSVQDARDRLADRNHIETHDGIVAGLTMGFWTAMFNSPWEKAWWAKQIKPTFPHMPRTERDRGSLVYRLQRMRRLRNSIAHHEAIWDHYDLADRYVEACALCRWVSPPLCCLVAVQDRFPLVYQEGPTAYVDAIHDMLSRPAEHRSGEHCY